jgi:trimethylamine:corrinoid methyltransferase-like protein
MTEKKKESPAMTHMREVSGRANEHLEKKLIAKIKIAKLNLQCDKIGAFQNPYLSLESIIKNCETVLQDIGIDVTFNDITHVMSRIGDDPSDIDPSIAIIRMNAIYIPTGAEFDPLTLTVSLDEKKRTAQGKKSAMTYAKRTFFMLQAEAKKKAQDKSTEDISAKKGKTAFTGTDIFQEDAK